MGWAGLPTGERVELVLVAVTLAAARRLGAIHHRLEPTGHVHVQHLVPPDEIMLQQLVVFGPFSVILCETVFDEGLEVEGEAHAEGQQRRIFLQNFGQNLKVCLAVLVGKLSRGQLHQRDAEAPHVCPDVIVRFGGIWRVYSLRRHVGSTAGAAGLGLGVDEASADAEVAQFDLTLRVQEDVGGFDVPVDDAVFLFQVQQRRHYRHCHLSKDSLWDRALDSLLQLLSTGSHQLHGDEYIRAGNYGAVALDDVRAVMTLQHHVQVHQDPLVLILVSCAAHLFDSDDVAGLLESHFEDLPTGSAADLPLADQVRHLRWIPLRTDKTQTTERDFGS